MSDNYILALARTCFAVVCLAMMAAIATSDRAAAQVEQWCTTTGVGLPAACFGSPAAACKKQMEIYSPSATFQGIIEGPEWWARGCDWSFVAGESRPAIVGLQCPSNMYVVAPGKCVEKVTMPMPACEANGRANPTVGNPIVLLTGTKILSADDFVRNL